MRSPALAIAWEFRHRHRWGLIAVAGYAILLATFKLFFLEPGQRVTLDPPDGTAGIIIAPLSMLCFYFVAAFSFGLDGDLSARQSIYPARMFTLPMTTAALAGWPMFFGTTAIASLWLATAAVARWSWGIELPMLWPALLVASFLAWTQALTWMPYGLPGMRVMATVLCLVTLDAVVLLAIYFKASETVMFALLAPQVPVAYFIANFAVGRARRGDAPDWRGAFARRRITQAAPKQKAPFASAGGAQTWFEWQRFGRSLPGWVAIILPCDLALLFFAGADSHTFVFYVLFFALLMPPVIAVFVARDSHAMTTFTTTRPLTSAQLVAAKLRMTVLTTLAAWLLVAAAILLALTLSHTWSLVVELVNRAVDALGSPRTIVLGLLVVATLVAATWKQLVQSLYIDLTGRKWLIRLHVGSLLLTLVFIGPFLSWLFKQPKILVGLWHALPWILALLMCTKILAASWVAIRLYRRQLVSDRTFVTGAAVWFFAVLALYATLVWLVDTAFIARYMLMLIAILAIPLARLCAAPLAFAWNRHR